jgi:hypothetical protein
MTFDEKDPPRMFSAKVLENKHGKLGTGIPRNIIVKRLFDYIARGISDDAIKVTDNEFSIEHRLSVYVLSPAQLERLVALRAERTHPSIPSISEME